MKYKRSRLEVTLRQDLIPGWGNKPEDHVKMLQETLDSSMGHYHPEVKLVNTYDEDSGEVLVPVFRLCPFIQKLHEGSSLCKFNDKFCLLEADLECEIFQQFVDEQELLELQNQICSAMLRQGAVEVDLP